MLLKKMVVPVVTGLLVMSAVVWAVEEQSDEDRERDVTERAPVSLAQAIRTAEHAVGGVAQDAGAEVEHGKSYYEVTTRTAAGDQEVRIDTASGKVLSRHRLAKVAGGRGTGGSTGSRGKGLTLAKAVERAESQAGGRALEAEARREHGQRVYRIELAEGKEIKKVTVHARDRSSPAPRAMGADPASENESNDMD